MNKTLLIIIILFSVTNIFSQDILINEFMSKNKNTIQDKDGDYSDWIELYNTTNLSINLLNYSLSDDNSNLNKWTFPTVTILPHSFLLVFASDKNILDTNELHTNFKLSSTGEKVYLSSNLGVLIDQTDSISLSNNQSYGRVPNGSVNWVVINTPSPNVSNNNSNQLMFSHQAGFCTSPYYLKINTLIPDTIYYTLNGDIPNENSSVFIDSLFVNNKSSEPNIISEIPTTPNQNLLSYQAWELPQNIIDKATVLRCATYKNGIRTSEIYTKSFFVDNKMFDKYTMPVISLIIDNNSLFNTDSGIYVPGINYDNNNPEWTGNYFMRGDNWERDVHIEYFDDNGNLGFAQDAGIRIHGGKTRQTAQKSLRLYARNKYGKKYFNYNLFPQKQISNYKRFILRTTMGSWGSQAIIKDVLAHEISNGLNIDNQDFQPVIVYLNGEYWGIHTIRDRIDEEYIAYTHNISSDSIEIKAWNNINYNNLIEFIENNDLSINSNYDYVKTQINIDNYIDYTITEMFLKNYDWPVNNITAWRKIPNGKWRWILYDLDAGFGDENYNMFNHSTRNDSTVIWPNSPSSTFLFRNLIKNEIFSNRFISRYADLLNNNFNIDFMIEKLDSIKEIYEPEIENHIYRWNYPTSFFDWENDIENDLLIFLKKRSCIVRTNIMAFFNLSSFDYVCNNIVGEDLEGNFILAPNPSRGNFFLFNNYTDLTNTTITITNFNGQIVYQENNITIMKNEKKYLDLSHLLSNTYLLQIKSDNYLEKKKIIIIK